MKKIYLILLISGYLFPIKSQNNTFLSLQKKYDRVSDAINDKGVYIAKNLSDNHLKSDDLNVLFVAYKNEKEFDVFAKKSSEVKYKKIATYNICKLSGLLGPKRKEGDGQVPEGFYYINYFNPVSTYYLSLGINYPNQSDKVKSTFPRLGGDIYIHGKCVTIGCLPMTDDKIKEIYLYALYAKDCGQLKIPVYIFPFKMSEENQEICVKKYPQWTEFWKNLKQGYDIFEKERRALKISVDKKGNYTFKQFD